MSWMSCLAIVFASLARLCEVEKMSGLDSRKLECAWMLGFIMRCQVDRMIAWNSVLYILCMDVPGCPLCNVWRCDPLRCETASRWLLRSRKVEGTVELFNKFFKPNFEVQRAKVRSSAKSWLPSLGDLEDPELRERLWKVLRTTLRQTYKSLTQIFILNIIHFNMDSFLMFFWRKVLQISPWFGQSPSGWDLGPRVSHFGRILPTRDFFPGIQNHPVFLTLLSAICTKPPTVLYFHTHAFEGPFVPLSWASLLFEAELTRDFNEVRHSIGRRLVFFAFLAFLVCKVDQSGPMIERFWNT